MRIDVPEYNTFVDFPDTMDMEAIKTKVREKFPPLVSTLTTQPPEGVAAQAARDITSPLGKDYTQPPTFTEKAKKALSTLAGAVSGEGYIGSVDQTAEEGIDRVVEAGKQTTEALTHTARGFAAWPIAKIAGLYINATFGAEMARKAEDGIMRAVTGQPKGEEAQNLFDTIGTVAGAPFIPAQFIGEQIGKIQPELGYAIGTGLEFATPMIGHYGMKRLTQFGKIYKSIKEGKELPGVERSILESMPENERMAAAVAIELAKKEQPKTLIEEFKKNGIPEKDAAEFVNTITEEPIKPIESPEMPPVEAKWVEGIKQLWEMTKEELEKNNIPRTVQRIEEPNVILSMDKPQGLYTSPADIESPHAELGGKKYILDTNPEAKVLTINTDFVKTNRGNVGESANIGVLKEFVGEAERNRLLLLSKSEAIQEVSAKYPNVDWTKYYDTQEIMEGYAGLLAKEKGYDAIWAIDKENPKFNEYVGLTKKAFKSEGKPVPKEVLKEYPELVKQQTIEPTLLDQYPDLKEKYGIVEQKTPSELPVEEQIKVEPTITPKQQKAMQWVEDEGIIDQSGNPIVVDKDGNVTLYHRTTQKAADQINKTGKFISKENTNETLFSNKPTGQAEGYGDTIITVKVPAQDVLLNDIFRDEIHVAVSNNKLNKENIVTPLEPAKEPRQLLENTFTDPTPDNINALMDMALNYTTKKKVYTGPKGGGRFKREVQGWRTFADAIGETPGKPDPRWKDLGFTSARDFVELTHEMKFREKAKQILDDPDFPSEKNLQAVEDYAIFKEDNIYEQSKIDPDKINEIEQTHRDEIANRSFEENVDRLKSLTKELSEEPVTNQQGQLIEAPFTLSGNQPIVGKTFVKPELRGERLPGMPEKATTNEILERIRKQPASEYEKTIADISKEVSKEIEVPPVGRARGLTIEATNEIPINTKKATYSFDDPNIEASYKAAHGVPKIPILDTVKEILNSLWEDITRTYKYLPNDEQFYPAQVILKRQEKARNKASYETLNALRGETHKFDSYQMDVYSRKVLLDDLMETSEKGKEIPFGFTPEMLKNELANIDAEIAKDPVIQKSYERRKQVQKALVDEYVGLRKHFGDDVSGKFKNENYYRHQVIEYAKVKGLSGTGEGMKVPTWRGFLKERKGSELPINTDYLQAEYEWRAQMLYDTQTLKTLKELDGQYNIIKDLKAKAKESGAEWQSLIPEGYIEWQPRRGNIFYTTDTIPAKLAEQLRDGLFEQIGITADDLRQSLSIGGKRKEMVIPEEVAKTLDELGQNKPENAISKLSKDLLTAWKVWTLISPTRFFKYNIRNMTGDADAVFVGNKSGFLKTTEATKDLYGTLFFDKPIEGKLKDFFDRSGFDTTLQAQEMGDINALKAFKNIADEHGGVEKIPGKVWNGYWKAARITTDFRELILRYANYIDYLEQIEKGGGKPNNYGASDPKKINSLKDYKDKAYELSNDLLGAYDRIGVTGQYIRGHVFPFWSWKEVNFKRYIQLFKNAADEGALATTIGQKILGTVTNPYTAYRVGSFIAKATTLWSVMQVWNNLMFPNEEKELSPDVRGRPHVIFGRDENGKILHFSRIGALGDFLEWFGLDAAPQTVDNWLSGKKTLLETAEDMAKSPVNTIVQGANPFIKVPFEIGMRQSMFPDVFKMAMIRDRGLHLARSLGLENEYKAVAGIPYEGYLSTLPQIFYYKADPGQGAYGEIQDLKRKFMEKIGKGYDGWMLTPKGQALYNIKLAIRYKDEESLIKSLEEYILLGGNNQGFKESIKAMEPLHGLKQKEQKAFIESLSVEDLERLEKAQIFYEKTLRGGLQ